MLAALSAFSLEVHTTQLSATTNGVYLAIGGYGDSTTNSPANSSGQGYFPTNDFQMFMMLQPTNGIPVPLRVVSWSWSASATNFLGVWSLKNASHSTNPTDSDTMMFPLWNSNVRQYQWQPPGVNLN